MSIKSILFNTDMVRAILDGRKSCKRRIVKPQQLIGMLPDKCKNGIPEEFLKEKKFMFKPYCDMTDVELISTAYQPPYQPGDILYVRETWYKDKYRYMYRANYSENEKFYRGGVEEKVDWHPSIHMPKEAARIWLKVTSVRVDRLQDITEDGALKEGAQGVRCYHAAIGAYGCTDCMNTGWLEPPTLEFMGIWDSTIKKTELDRYGWNANPWVWVIEFERREKPKEVN